MIHETFLYLTETAFGSHPCRVVSATYRTLRPFHRGDRPMRLEPLPGAGFRCKRSKLFLTFQETLQSRPGSKRITTSRL